MVERHGGWGAGGGEGQQPDPGAAATAGQKVERAEPQPGSGALRRPEWGEPENGAVGGIRNRLNRQGPAIADAGGGSDPGAGRGHSSMLRATPGIPGHAGVGMGTAGRQPGRHHVRWRARWREAQSRQGAQPLGDQPCRRSRRHGPCSLSGGRRNRRTQEHPGRLQGPAQPFRCQNGVVALKPREVR